MTEQEKLKHCSGCRNDFYNDKNPMGIKRCWSLDTAELVLKKEVSMSQVPPWTQKPKQVLSCYHRDGFIYVPPEKER